MDFRSRRRRRPPSENIVPLINVVFLLLIFFMLTGTLRAPSPLEVQLPTETRDSAATPPDDETPVLILSATGELALARVVLTTETLVRTLEQAGTRTLALRADARTPARLLLPLLESLQQAGIEQLDLVTDRAR